MADEEGGNGEVAAAKGERGGSHVSGRREAACACEKPRVVGAVGGRPGVNRDVGGALQRPAGDERGHAVDVRRRVVEEAAPRRRCAPRARACSRGGASGPAT